MFPFRPSASCAVVTGIADIFDRMNRGDDQAADSLLPLVYEQLRRLAASKMRNESGSQTLQPTALVHEAWLRIAGDSAGTWQNKAHFFNAAAQAMRRILVDRSRTKSALKRQPRHDLFVLESGAEIEPGDHILMIHEALNRLEIEDADGAQIVILKFYSGLTTAEIAKMSNRGIRSVERHWNLAKIRLYQILSEDGFGGNSPPAP
ncbi:MAG: polymerase subunit sigma-24 [Akkermansiaceae bacterium]|nr:polymerase subunit sigma-24 [Akkermansiaceae bacterium]